MDDETGTYKLGDVAAEMYLDGYAAFQASLNYRPGSVRQAEALREAQMFQAAGSELRKIADVA